MSETALRVGVWPATDRFGNAFVGLFADGIRAAGATVVDISDASRIDPATIDVLHIHWPEQVFWLGGGVRQIALRVLRTVRTLRALKRQRVTIVWMVHNLRPHDMSWKRRALWHWLSPRLCVLVDGFMTLSPATIAVVRAGLPGLRSKPARFAWLPAYPEVPQPQARAGLRDTLGVTDADRIVGFLGLLRPYKGVEALIAAFRKLDDSHARLLIAGAASDASYTARLTELARPDPRIRIIARHLSEAEFSAYLAAIDVVVLPFRSYLHSSSMLHVLSGHCPVLTPDTPFAHALAEAVGPGWVTTYPGAIEPASLRHAGRPSHPPDLAAFSPLALGLATCAFYRELQAGPRSQA